VLNALDVIWIRDECISPPGPKMVVCVESALGYFFRINTRGHRPGSVPLKKAGLHEFLDHDSHLECGGPLELDDYVIDDSLSGRGVIGQVSAALIPEILQAIDGNKELAAKDKATIKAFLSPLIGDRPGLSGTTAADPAQSESALGAQQKAPHRSVRQPTKRDQ
jgi:hypothetical protein